jgi:hypothetical protein
MVSGVKLSSRPKRILRESEGFQLAIEVLKSQGFSGSFCCLGIVASFMYIGGVFNPRCCVFKLDVGVDF